MIEYTLDLINEHDYMINYKIVSFLYEIRDNFLINDNIEYTDIIVNYKILYLIDEINFTYVKGLDLNNIQHITKIGYLLNLKVYLDPIMDENNIILLNKMDQILIKLNF